MAWRWRERWLVLQPVSLEELPVADRLTDAPHPSKPVRITAEQVAKIVALAGDPPTASQRPISQWTSANSRMKSSNAALCPRFPAAMPRAC